MYRGWRLSYFREGTLATNDTKKREKIPFHFGYNFHRFTWLKYSHTITASLVSTQWKMKWILTMRTHHFLVFAQIEEAKLVKFGENRTLDINLPLFDELLHAVNGVTSGTMSQKNRKRAEEQERNPCAFQPKVHSSFEKTHNVSLFSFQATSNRSCDKCGSDDGGKGKYNVFLNIDAEIWGEFDNVLRFDFVVI